MSGDLNEDCMSDWNKCNGVARLLIWTQAFEEDGGHKFGCANRTLYSCYQLGLEQLEEGKHGKPGPFFRKPSWTGSIVGGHPLDEPCFPRGMTPWQS